MPLHWAVIGTAAAVIYVAVILIGLSFVVGGPR